jgi:hypothetical protein
MTQDEALTLFEKEAAKLEKTHVRQKDLILALAQIMANSKETLSPDCLAALVHIGAHLYKGHLNQNRARADIAKTMQDSTQGEMRSL